MGWVRFKMDFKEFIINKNHLFRLDKFGESTTSQSNVRKYLYLLILFSFCSFSHYFVQSSSSVERQCHVWLRPSKSIKNYYYCCFNRFISSLRENEDSLRKGEMMLDAYLGQNECQLKMVTFWRMFNAYFSISSFFSQKGLF